MHSFRLVSTLVNGGCQALLKSDAVVNKRRADAMKARLAKKEHSRRLELANYRDRMRRRKLADGEPIPDDLKEQEWERALAKSEVRRAPDFIVVATIDAVLRTGVTRHAIDLLGACVVFFSGSESGHVQAEGGLDAGCCSGSETGQRRCACRHAWVC